MSSLYVPGAVGSDAFFDFSTQVLHLTTHVEIVNNTLLPFKVDVIVNGKGHHIGSCVPKSRQLEAPLPSSVGGTSGIDSKRTRSFSIPIPLLEEFCKDWGSYGRGTITLMLTPSIVEEGNSLDISPELSGKVDLTASLVDLKRSVKGHVYTKADVTCRSQEKLGRSLHPFALQVCLKSTLVANEHVTMSVSLEPRGFIQNKIPLAMTVRTPMPQTFSVAKQDIADNKEVTYELEPEDRIEVFTPGPSIAISLRPRDIPVAGNELGWMDAGWIDLPLVPEFSLQDPILSLLPSVSGGSGDPQPRRETGAEVVVVEGQKSLENLNESTKSQNNEGDGPTSPRAAMYSDLQQNARMAGPLSFFLTVRNYGVDHTGTILFEQALAATNQAMRMMSSLWQSEKLPSELRGSIHHSFLDDMESFAGLDSSSRHLSRRVVMQPLGAFASPHQRQRISLLPNQSSALRLLQMTMDGEEGFRRTMVSRAGRLRQVVSKRRTNFLAFPPNE